MSLSKKCQCTIKDGSPCKNPATPGSIYCWRHQDCKVPQKLAEDIKSVTEQLKTTTISEPSSTRKRDFEEEPKKSVREEPKKSLKKTPKEEPKRSVREEPEEEKFDPTKINKYNTGQLSKFLTIANVPGRGSATTVSQKIDLLMKHYNIPKETPRRGRTVPETIKVQPERKQRRGIEIEAKFNINELDSYDYEELLNFYKQMDIYDGNENITFGELKEKIRERYSEVIDKKEEKEGKRSDVKASTPAVRPRTPPVETVRPRTPPLDVRPRTPPLDVRPRTPPVEIPATLSSRRAEKVIESKSSRSERAQDISTKSSRRYLIATRSKDFKNFLCNMLQYVGEMKTPLEFYPIGYVSYLLRAHAFDTASVVPLDTTELTEDKESIKMQSIDIKEAFNSLEKNTDIHAYKMIEGSNGLVYPLTAVYLKDSTGNITATATFVKEDMNRLFEILDHRYIFVYLREIVLTEMGADVRPTQDSYLPIVIDRKENRRTIDIFDKYNMQSSAEDVRAYIMKNMIPGFENYNVRICSNVPGGLDPVVWEIMMINLKLLNPVDSFTEINTKFSEMIANNMKGTEYSYYMRILRLCPNEKIDLQMLQVFHGSG
jgi:hypothetical protein